MELDGHKARIEKAIVLDLGHKYTKIGFTGEAEPRCIVPSRIWSIFPHRCHYVNPWDAKNKYGNLVNFYDLIFFKYLGVNPREYKIVIVTVPVWDIRFYEKLEEIFFSTYKVPGVIWADSWVMCALTLGTPLALIISIGASKTVVSAVTRSESWSIPTTYLLVDQAEISRRLADRLDKDNNTKLYLLEDILEDIKIKTCYVTTRERAEKWANGETLDAKSVEYHMPGNVIRGAAIKVSGRTRELALEEFFVRRKCDFKLKTSLAHIVLECIAGSPAEFRRDLAANILITGGMAAVPGMKARVAEELRYLSKLEYPELGVEEFKFHSAPAQDNCVAWLGGALAGACVAEAVRFLPDVVVPDGPGEPLGSIPGLRFSEYDSADLKILHQIIYGKSCLEGDTLGNIEEFHGYEWDVNSKLRREMIDETIMLGVALIETTCDMLNLEKTGSVRDMSERLEDFLHSPRRDYKSVPKPKNPYEAYKPPCKRPDLKGNLDDINVFCGYECVEGSLEYKCRLEIALELSCSIDPGGVRQLCRKLQLHQWGTRREVTERLMKFLVVPGFYEDVKSDHPSGNGAEMHAGRGTPLGKLFPLETFKEGDIYWLHSFIYESFSVSNSSIRLINVKKFHGFECDLTSPEFRCRLSAAYNLADGSHKEVRDLCKTLNLDHTDTSMIDVTTRLMTFLHTPGVHQEFKYHRTDVKAPVGMGLPLGALFRFEDMKKEDLKLLHKFIYRKEDEDSNIIRNIKKFYGFDYNIDSRWYEYRVKDAERLGQDIVRTLCNMLSLGEAGTIDELAERLVKFLHTPVRGKHHTVFTDLPIPAGRGVPLGDIFSTDISLFTPDEVKMLHYLLYDKRCSYSDMIRNVKKFHGFEWELGSWEHKFKVEETTVLLSPDKIQTLCEMLHLDVEGTTTEMAERLVTFLQRPTYFSYDISFRVTDQGIVVSTANRRAFPALPEVDKPKTAASGETASAAGGTTSEGPGPVSASAAGGTTSEGPGPVSASAAGGTTSEGPGPVSASAAGGTTSEGPGPVSASAAGGTTSKGSELPELPDSDEDSESEPESTDEEYEPKDYVDGGSVPGEVSVRGAPGDAVAALRWSPAAAGGRFLLAAGWDCRVRCWEVRKGQKISTMPVAMHSMSGPILDVAWHHEGSKVFMASTDKTVKCWDLVANTAIQVGSHDGPVSTCHWVTSPNCNVLMTGSWDKTLKFWDLRSRDHVTKIELPERCYCADAVYPMAVVGTADQKIGLYSLTGKPAEVARFDSPLRHQHSCIAIFNHEHTLFKNKYPVGFALGDVGGQVAIKYVNISNAKDGYTFQCHRTTGKHQYQEAYAVNDMCFSPSSATLATAGSDGRYSFWDRPNSNPRTSARRGQPLTNCCFDHSGELFAYAVGYDWSKGHEYLNRDSKAAIYIRPFSEDWKTK